MSMGRRAKKRLWAVVRYGLLLALMAFTLLPVLWMFVSSLKAEADIWEAVPRWIPRQATLENYVWAFGPYSANIVPLLFEDEIGRKWAQNICGDVKNKHQKTENDWRACPTDHNACTGKHAGCKTKIAQQIFIHGAHEADIEIRPDH